MICRMDFDIFFLERFFFPEYLGPVRQSPNKLILGLWKNLIAIYLVLRKDFLQDYGLRKSNL